MQGITNHVLGRAHEGGGHTGRYVLRNAVEKQSVLYG